MFFKFKYIAVVVVKLRQLYEFFCIGSTLIINCEINEKTIN